MKTYAISQIGTCLIVTTTDGDKENIDVFNLLTHRIELSKSAEAIILQNEFRVLTIKSVELTSPVLVDYTALKTQLATWQLASAQVVSGKLTKVLDTFTTAAGATAYTAGDIITSGASANQRWLNVGCNSGYLVGLNLEFEVSATLTVPGTLPNVNIRFFNETHASLNIADNSPREVVWANNSRRLGSIALGALAADVVGGVGRIHVNTDDIRFPFAGLTDGKLFYSIESNNNSTLGISGFGRPASLRGKVDQNI
jgi:hypothetical protein